MQTNPYITITGNVSKFDTDNHSFTMTLTQYIVLTHTVSPFPIHAYFADTNSKKRWGTEGPKVAVRSTVTVGSLLQQVVRQCTLNRTLESAQVEIMNIAYLTTQSNLANSPIRTFTLSLQRSKLIPHYHSHPLEDRNTKSRKRWTWNDLSQGSQLSLSTSSSQPITEQAEHSKDKKTSPHSQHSLPSTSSSHGKRKQDADDSNDDEDVKRELEKTADDSDSEKKCVT